MSKTLSCARKSDYWAAVTDVPCVCHGGIVRWAEAGHVAGWRECDLCGRTWMAAGTSEAPALELRGGPTHRVTASRRQEIEEARRQGEDHLLRSHIEFARKSAAEDMRGSFLGTDWHAIGLNVFDEPGVREAYLQAWRANADPRAVAALDRLPSDLILPGEGRGAYGFPFRPVVGGITRDGERVHVYRDGSGGFYPQSIEDALAGKVINA